MRKNRVLFLWCMAISAIFLAICSQNSFLYLLNDWVDVHCFFTMGRSILDGLVPYRDLYEQKGPVLYFLYAIASMLSRDTFWGVYILEFITFGLFLYFSGKIAALYLGDSKIIFLMTALLATIIPVSSAFSHGGSVEELTLFTLVYSLYSVLKALKEERPLTFGEAVCNGICASVVLWIKFTIMGFYIGLCLFVLVWYISKRYSLLTLLKTVGQFLLGVAIVSAIVFLYFGIHGALDDLFTVYFYNNLFLYPSEWEGSRWDLIVYCLKCTIQLNTRYWFLILLGLGGLFLQILKGWRQFLCVMLCFAGLVIGTYWGGKNFPYYGMIFPVFSIFGLIFPVQVFRRIRARIPIGFSFPKKALAGWIAIALCVPLLMGFAYRNGGNVHLMGYEKDAHPAYRFAKIINTVEDATLLNYGFLDGGFYYAAGVTPNCKYFCYFNIPAPDMWKTQNEMISNGEVDFIVTRKYKLTQYSPNSSHYVCVDEATMLYGSTEYTYYLYQKIK